MKKKSQWRARTSKKKLFSLEKKKSWRGGGGGRWRFYIRTLRTRMLTRFVHLEIIVIMLSFCI